MNNIKKVIKNNGIFKVEDIYEESLIDDVKEKVRSQLNHTDNKERIESDKLYSLGILDQLFNSKLKYLINTIIPDGVLWHCMFLKTKSGQKISTSTWRGIGTILQHVQFFDSQGHIAVFELFRSRRVGEAACTSQHDLRCNLIKTQ